jgi:hypothetical protein
MNANLLVINKVDLAPLVGADLAVMQHDAESLRSGPLVFTDCRRGEGVAAVAAWLTGEIEALKASRAADVPDRLMAHAAAHSQTVPHWH